MPYRSCVLIIYNSHLSIMFFHSDNKIPLGINNNRGKTCVTKAKILKIVLLVQTELI